MTNLIEYKGKEYEIREKNGKPYLATVDKPSRLLKEKLRWAKNYLAEKLVEYDEIRFAYNGDEVIALQKGFCHEFCGDYGIAKRNKNDTYSIEIGQAIALARCLVDEIPGYMFE